MPPKYEKLLAKLRQTKRNWSSGDLHTILKGVGFEWHDSKHRVYRHPDFPDLGSYPLPRGYDPLAPAYAKKVLELADSVLAAQGEGGDDG